MAQIIGLPKLSPTMEEGVLVRWVKKKGDKVEPGNLVAEVETDKANMDFNSEDEGTILELLVGEGETVKLGAPVAILGDPGEDVSKLMAQAKSSPAPAPAPAAAPAPAPAPARASAPAPAPAPAAKGQLLASPLAKTLAIDLGVDLRQVSGTGPGGRIVERDVRAFAESGGGAAAPEPAPVAEAEVVEGPATAMTVVRGPRPTPMRIPDSAEWEDQPLSPIRKRIAERMAAAKRDIPHIYLTREIDAAPMLDFRKRLNALLGDRGKVSVNDLIIKGTALALRRVPECNVAFMGDAIRYFTRVHIGVAVATERGLVTPVVRDADLKGIGVISADVADLAHRARERQLKVPEIQGSTFTVTNLGMMGIDSFQAIINPPEACILAVGTMRDTPVVRDGMIAVGKRMALTLCCDHRVVDGAVGARYLGALAELLEKPESLAL